MTEQAVGAGDRAELVRAAVRTWRSQLIDLGGRNTLLYYRDLRAGTLDLGIADQAAVTELLAGRDVAVSRLFPVAADFEQARRRARTIRNKARELREERGIETCFLALGTATWENPRGTAQPAAPVLLRRLDVKARAAAEDDFTLGLTGEPEVNPTLVHVLASDHGVTVDPDELLDLLPETGPFDPTPVFERLVKLAAGTVRGFGLTPRLVVGNFTYAKLPMVADLERSEDLLVGHDVVAAIAGDREAQQRLRTANVTEVSERAPDFVPPADEFLVLDADSSQNFAINAVLAGHNIVVKGPPGTGKSQTICNLVASLAARGQRVLFVAEKRAAISAVLDRLARHGLGDLAIDVHDGGGSRGRVAAQIKAALDAASSVPLPDLRVLHQTLAERRAALNGYTEALHAKREPFDLSAFEAQCRIAGLRRDHGDAVATTFRLRGAELARVDAATARATAEALYEYAGLGGLTLTPAESPWIGAAVTTPEQAQAALDAAGRLARQTLPGALPVVARAVAETGLRQPATLAQWAVAFGLYDGVAATLGMLVPEAWDGPLAEAVAATAKRSWRKEHRDRPGAGAGFFARRRLRKTARRWWRDGRPSRDRLFAALSAAEAQRRTWAAVSADGGPPRLPADLATPRAAWAALDAEVTALSSYVRSVDLRALPEPELRATLDRLAADDRTLRKVPRLNALAAGFAALGLGPLLTELAARRPSPDAARAAFEWAWAASVADQARVADPRLGTFDGELHGRTAADYRAKDVEHVTTTAVRVRRAVAENVVRTRDRFPDESTLVEHQANLKRRHLPMRELFRAAPNLLTALKPCWAMSPLVVSQLLPADRQYFDVVVFDEASQVTPADAIPSIMRARQVVVAGDQRQLPPTSFFTAAVGEDEQPADEASLAMTTGYESILDVFASALGPGGDKTLRWHYRSRDERLIAFSNAWIYDRSLVTFPGVLAGGSLRHVHVRQARGAGQEESVTAEVERVVELCLEHARTRPEETLGVIAMGIQHAERIETAVFAAVRDNPDVASFFDQGRDERFFVKNLERVQGDERDAIVLSVGYGKSANGKLPYRFGPLNMEGGERRLNVAVTRARRRMTLVSSFTAADMDPTRSAAEGVKLLRAYLEYAESAGTNLGAASITKPPLDPFELDVRDRLVAAGIPVVPQYGVAGYWVDFAVPHPADPSRMVLAIEADGAAYHSTPTARDRDRLRQEQLQRLGWAFHRIWSTEWFEDPAAEVERVRRAYEAAVARADAPPPVAAAPVAAPVEPAEELVPGRAGPRPPLRRGRPITEYSPAQLVRLVRWIESDTLLRTEEELVEEVMRDLGFKRRGPRIVAAIQAAVAAARADR